MPPPDRRQLLRHLLSDPAAFSQGVAERPLRRYQLEPARAILASVLGKRGLTFTVMMSRQAGKNELSAQLEAILLLIYSRRGGSIVKCAPTFRPQLVNSMLRLQAILDNDITRTRWATSMGYILAVGKARAFFLSASQDSSIVGATASLLLEVDEAQDVDEDKYLKDFRPMGASTNVTTVLYGTSWTDDTLLEHTIRENARLEDQDGIQRNFRYPWDQVGAENPDYARFVQSEISRMGPEHPLVRTQYLLHSLSSGGRMFSAEQLVQLQGSHPRQGTPDDRSLYVAGIDLAGGDEEDEALGLTQGRESRRDSTTLSIARVTWSQVLGVDQPSIDVVNLRTWLNVRHRDLFDDLVATLRLWRCTSVVVDASGIGAGVASFLVGALGADLVHPFTFTSVSKSDLGYQLLTVINSGRIRMYNQPPTQESEELWRQARLAKSSLHANQRLSFQVDPRQGHDDFLIALALVIEAAQHSRPRSAVGRVAR